MTDQAPQRTRLSKSKATASTTAIQTLEITTIVTADDPSPPATDDPDDIRKSRHHHHHHVKSPVFAATGQPSPSNELELPPPLIKGPSEAIVALQDAANGQTTNTKEKKASTSKKGAVPAIHELFASSFFSSALLIQWSNLVGPKVEKVWSVEPLDEKTQMMIGRQVLNGEMGRTLTSVEPKWIVLHAMICTAFLYQDHALNSLCALVFVLPVRYLRNFSPYFNVLCERVPNQLIDPLVKLRKLHKPHSLPWSTCLDYFTTNQLLPFIKSVMDLESVSLPIDCVKTSHTILDHESRQMLDSPFIAKVITSHLQTYGSTLLIGNTITTMNMVINTLALFLTAEERSRSSHARKHHHYMPDLYLQGLLIQDVEEMESRVELAVLDSTAPTTLVDMTRLIVRRTPLFTDYTKLKSSYYEAVSSKLEDDLLCFANKTPKSSLNDWSKRSSVFQQTEGIAPMVQTLLDETRKVPTRMREAYVRQWRRTLVRRALAMIKFVQDETPVIVSQPTDNDLATRIMNALALYNLSDFMIILTQAEKLRPGMVQVIKRYSKIEL